MSSEGDKIKKARKYMTADEWHELQMRKAIIIQCFFRQVKARMVTKKLREGRAAFLAEVKNEEHKLKLAEKKKKQEVERRLHPKTQKDFEILYAGLEKWRIQEANKINSFGYTEPARLAALADLMDQECALLQKIDKLKNAGNGENREKAVVRLLENMASPKKWLCRDNKYVHVDTPHTIRARELRDLYHALNLQMLSVDERLQILLHVKYTVKEFDCNLTREIVELIDREGDLVCRGRSDKSLEGSLINAGLRKRISNLFLQFIKTPEFNPAAQTHQRRIKSDITGKKLDAAVYYCTGCTSYKPSTEFYLNTTMKHLGKCKQCTNSQNIAFDRSGDSVYSDMLKLVRVQESQKRFESEHHAVYNVLSLLQESDMRYLIDVVWNGRSAVSGASNLQELMLTRWDVDTELTPWNCVLLTKAEAATHDAAMEAGALEETYSAEFCSKVHQKHVMSRKHFQQLPAISKYMAQHYEEIHGQLVRKRIVG